MVKTEDLIAGLESQKVAGACLDVFENEKPTQFSPEETQLYQRLYDLENVVLSPHVAGWTRESKLKMAQILIRKILK